MPTERLESLVIGAGQAGLGVSRELVRRGVDHLVLERGDIGETWRSQRWDAFRLNSPGWMNRLPDDVAAVEPDAFPSAPEFVRGLERYAFRQRLPVRRGVTVLAVAPLGTAEGFSIATDDGVFEARSVVVASGASRVPRIPAVASALPGSVLQLHAAAFRGADALPAGAVLVVGGAQSGVQIADDLLDAGRDVYLATSRVGRVPRRYRGRDAFAWLVDDGFFDERLPGRGVAPPTSPQISGAGGGRTLSLQHLERRGATLLGRLTGASGSRIALADDVAGNAAFADADAVACAVRRRIDAHIERAGADAAVARAGSGGRALPGGVAAAGAGGARPPRGRRALRHLGERLRGRHGLPAPSRRGGARKDRSARGRDGGARSLRRRPAVAAQPRLREHLRRRGRRAARRGARRATDARAPARGRLSRVGRRGRQRRPPAEDAGRGSGAAAETRG